MELPFYLNYKEFEKNYYNNLEKWFERYHNTSETDFLKAFADLYSPYLYYSFANGKIMTDASIQIKDCFFPSYEKIGISFCGNCENIQDKNSDKMNHLFEWKTISMMEYAQYILDKINRYFSKNKKSLKDGESILDYINDYDIIISREGAEYCVNYKKHQSTLPFLKAYLPVYGQTVDMATYRDFIFSVVQIAEFIDQKLKEDYAQEKTIFARLKSEAQFKVQMSRQFLTICN